MSSPTDQAMLRDSLRGVTDEHTYGGIVSFMRRRYSRDLAEVDVAVLGIPFDLAFRARGVSQSGVGR